MTVRGTTLATATIAALLTSSAAFPQAPNWRDVEAANGAIYKVNMNSISPDADGSTEVIVYAADGSTFNPDNLRRLWFTCKAHYRDLTVVGIGPLQYAPPRSIAGRIGEIACSAADEARRRQPVQQIPKDTPDQYCTGFSREACARIVAAVEAKPKPSYCKLGFALAGSGLSDEQVRICRVIIDEEARLRDIRARGLDKNEQARTSHINLSATRGGFPTIVGSTDLPEGTKLLVRIKKPYLPNAEQLLAAGLPMCEDDCLPAIGPKGESLGVRVTVQSGAFSAGPFSWRTGKPIRPGDVEVEIFLVALPGQDESDLVETVKRMKNPISKIAVNISP